MEVTLVAVQPVLVISRNAAARALEGCRARRGVPFLPYGFWKQWAQRGEAV